MLCAGGPGQRPPEYDRRFCEKLAVTSALPLTVLECPYKNFASDRIFSLQLPLSDGSESMRIPAPYPEIGAPKFGKMWGLIHIVYAYFSPFFGMCTPRQKYCGRQNFGRGRYAVPEIMAKKRVVAKPILRQDVGRRPADTAAQLLTISGISHFTRCTYASDARDVASLSGQSQACMYMHNHVISSLCVLWVSRSL